MSENNRFSSVFSGRNRILLGVPVLFLIGLAAFFLFRPPVPEVEVNFIEVGQADSILLRSSEGKVMLIDGGYPHSGAYDYLKANNITHIDVIVLTHVHDDHAGGLPEIIANIPVDKVITNGQDPLETVIDDWRAALKKSGAEVSVVRAGDKISLGSLTFDVLGPRKINPTSYNNNSIVLRLEVGKISFLFTGDLQKLEEQRLLDVKANIKANILKVAHHAADTSSMASFVEKVSPDIAIYFAEIGNIHGFPHQVTMDTFKAFNIPVYGTDVNGTITVKTDGKTFTVTAERGGPVEP